MKSWMDPGYPGPDQLDALFRNYKHNLRLAEVAGGPEDPWSRAASFQAAPAALTVYDVAIDVRRPATQADILAFESVMLAYGRIRDRITRAIAGTLSPSNFLSECQADHASVVIYCRHVKATGQAPKPETANG